MYISAIAKLTLSHPANELLKVGNRALTDQQQDSNPNRYSKRGDVAEIPAQYRDRMATIVKTPSGTWKARITGSQVIIYLIADGRRDMQSMFARRLLSA